jgi:hypothetical protein
LTYVFFVVIIALKSNSQEVILATTQVNFIERSWFMSNTNPKTRRNKVATIRWRVPEVVVTNYLAAADDAARAATAAGQLIAAADDLSRGVPVKVTVGSAFEDSTAVPPEPDQFVFPFDKFGISFRADGENYVSSIPARDDANVTVGGDGISVILGDAATDEIKAFVLAFENIVLSEEGGAATITQITVTS